MAGKRQQKPAYRLHRTYRVKSDLITTGQWLKGQELTEEEIAAYDSVERLLEMDAIEAVDTPVPIDPDAKDAEGGEGGEGGE